MSSLPDPIREAIAGDGGLVTFARFMDLALTHPEAGYYTSPDRTLGPSGDFTTAPRKVPAFNRALARLLAELIDALRVAREGREGGEERVAIIEVGPGEGDLAAGVMAEWQDERPDLRERVTYRLVEVGEGLRRRQEEALLTHRQDGWSVSWPPALEAWGSPGAAIVVTNELLDALPVHRLTVTAEGVREAWVELVDGRVLEERWLPASEQALREVDLLFGTRDPARLRVLSQDGCLEVRPGIGEFVRRVEATVSEGFVVTVDYGGWLAGPPVESSGPVEPESHRRTVRCYYRHQRRASPYDVVGRQDITADVDFRALALHGARAGFECLVYTSLAVFLQAMGLQQELDGLRSQAASSLDRDMEAGALAALLDEGGIGGTFKVMVQVREGPGTAPA